MSAVELSNIVDEAPWLGAGTDMDARMRALDWHASGLGPLSDWPQSLRSAVSICLGSRFPMVVLWGPRLSMIYNDAYAPLLGHKHPCALGRGIAEVWDEIADVIAPLMDGVMKTGAATWIPDGYLALERHGMPEETYFSYSFGPIRIEDGSVGGILAVTIETTERVVSERRLAFLKALADATAGVRDAAEVCARALALVGEGTPDLRRATIHLGDAPPPETIEPHTLAVPIQAAERSERFGTLVVALNPLRPLDEACREFVGLVGRQIARSIADARALEAERSRTHADVELRRIFEQAPSFVCIMKGPEHVFEFVNRAHAALFNSAAWIGKPVREAFPDIAHQGYFERLDEVYRTGERFIATGAPLRYRYSPQSPVEERVLDFIYAPIRDDAGRITGIFCEGFDISAQRAAEQQLDTARQQTESQRRLYEAILTNTPDLAYVFDLQHRFVYANDGLLRMWGKTWHEAIGKTCLELGYEPWHAEMHDREIEQVVGTRLPIRGEVPFDGAFGRRIYDYIFVPVIGEGGEVIAVAGTTRDITEIKEMEAQLREGDRRKDEFLGMLAHELRNPLAPLRNGLAIIRRLGSSAEDGARLQDVRAMMDRQVVQMVRLIDDLLDVTRITSGKIRISSERVALAEVVQAAVETSQPLIEQAGHALTIAAPARPVLIDADPTRLAQVFANLLTNAAKFTAPGGQIRIATEPGAGEVTITVSDNGEGIPADMLTQIFDMFVQVDRSLEREKSGLGLGLCLARGLVLLHGGSIEARSEGRGRGSEFIVRLPLPIEPVAGPGTAREVDAELDRLTGRRVLIADDNTDAADSLALLLGLIGSEARVVHNGRDALAEAERFRPELVFLDIGMPGLNGYEVCEQLKAMPAGREMVVVALTGWGQDKDRQRGRQAGFDGHLVKPVGPEAIRSLIVDLSL